MLTNEMYLDSADIRKNIVSINKDVRTIHQHHQSHHASIDVTINNVTGSVQQQLLQQKVQEHLQLQ